VNGWRTAIEEGLAAKHKAAKHGAMTTETPAPLPGPLNVSFLGLGVMGSPMARHIAAAGHKLTVFNRSPARLEAWQKAHPTIDARLAHTPAEAAEGADAVVTCVGNDDDLADVVLGPTGVFTKLRRGAVFIDHTTVSAKIARQIAVEGRDKEVLCVDAPVTGGQSGAEAGTLSIMCGGTAKAIEAARPVLEAYSSRITHVGKAGAGQLAKMCNQFCIAGALAGMGGIGGLLAQFQQAGLGHIAESWVGGGPNQPVSPDQLNQVLGSSRVHDIAQQAGMNPGDLLSQLSHLLPHAVDQLTPNGVVPAPGHSPFDEAGQNL